MRAVMHHRHELELHTRHTCKTVSQITYTVLVETLNPAQSINQSVSQSVKSLNFTCSATVVELLSFRTTTAIYKDCIC